MKDAIAAALDSTFLHLKQLAAGATAQLGRLPSCRPLLLGKINELDCAILLPHQADRSGAVTGHDIGGKSHAQGVAMHCHP